MTTTAPTTSTRRRDLRLLAGAVLLSAAGDLLAIVTLALVVHDLSGDGLVVAAYFAAMTIPVVVLAPLAGHLADRVESVRLLVLSSVAQAVLSLLLALAAGDVPAILVLSVLLAAGSAVSQPAEFALLPAVVGDGDLQRANGVMETARYAGFALGPLTAAGLAALAGPEAALIVNAASFAAIAAGAGLLHARRPPPLGAGTHRVRAREGLVHLTADPELRRTLVPAVAALLCISASWTVEVFYVKEVLGAGDASYALLMVVWMAAMAVGATGIAGRIRAEHLPAAALLALLVQGAGMASQTIWAVVPMAMAGYAVGGLGHGVKNTLLRTLIQRRVSAAAHGRAFAAYNAARNAAELVAFAAGGLLVSAVGARSALIVAGLGPVLAAALGLAALRRAGGRGATVPPWLGLSRS